MHTARTLREAIQQTIDKGTEKKSVLEIAEDCGVSDSTIYRWNKDEDSTSFADLPLRRLRSFMEATGSLSILNYFERKFNRIAFPVPKASLNKKSEDEMTDDYQFVCLSAHQSLRKFLQNPTVKNFEEVEDALRTVMCKSAAVKKYCEKKLSGQFELNLEEK